MPKFSSLFAWLTLLANAISDIKSVINSDIKDNNESNFNDFKLLSALFFAKSKSENLKKSKQ